MGNEYAKTFLLASGKQQKQDIAGVMLLAV
jgi:hypothetical protein